MADIKTYTISNIETRDQWKSDFGVMQDYAVALEGEEGWIKLTQKVDTKPPQRGDELEGYIQDKSNTNGTAYRKFKKESAQYAGAGRSSETVISDGSQLSYITQMLEELTGRRDVADRDAKTPDEPLEDPFGNI